MSEPLDRRTRTKAETREHIRGVAHRLFDEQGFDAVTIADIARSSDVAVQTVFNHFATKEELFFDGRGPRIDAPSEAIRSRGPGVPPLTALRDFLVGLARTRLGSMVDEQRRRYTLTLLASDSLRAYERELLIEVETRLAATLTDAWSEGSPTGIPIPADAATSAAVVAAMWCSAVRVLIHSSRQRLTSGACPWRSRARSRASPRTCSPSWSSPPREGPGLLRQAGPPRSDLSRPAGHDRRRLPPVAARRPASGSWLRRMCHHAMRR